MTTQTESDPGNTSGRPRNQQIDESVIATTAQILDTAGYAGVTFEAVARKAGTSRPALYRRWESRADLILDAIASRLNVPTPPDNGCTLCDIDDSFNIFLAAYREFHPTTLSALYADCAADPQLRERYLQTLVEPARQAVGIALDRATERGDLRPDMDRTLLLDMVGSLVQYRVMFAPEHLSDHDAGRAIEALLQGAAVDYPALVAHSEELEHKDMDAAHHDHSAPE